MKSRIIKILLLCVIIINILIPNNMAASTKVLLGDINKDTVIDTRDLLLIMRPIVAVKAI